jgi:hypothetical protein
VSGAGTALVQSGPMCFHRRWPDHDQRMAVMRASFAVWLEFRGKMFDLVPMQ